MFTTKTGLQQSNLNMLTENHHLQLQNAAYQFEHGSFGHPEFEEVMQEVFGDNRTGVEATKWRHY